MNNNPFSRFFVNMKHQLGLLLVFVCLKLCHGEVEKMIKLRSGIKSVPIPVVPFPSGNRKPNRLQEIGGKPPPPPPPPTRKPFSMSTEDSDESTSEEQLTTQTFPPVPSVSNSSWNIVTDEPEHGHPQHPLPTSRPRPTFRPTRRRPPTPPTKKPLHTHQDDRLVYSISRLDDDGGYFFDFLASNSVFRQEQGFFKPDPENEDEKIHVKTGAYGFTSPEGARVRVDYVADEFGYRAFDNAK